MTDRKMRRSERQADEMTIRQILKAGEYGVFCTLSDDGFPYGVPVNYVFDGEKIYFHCAKSGHKLDNIDGCDKVCFTVVSDCEVISQKLTTHYRSVVVFGTAKRCEKNKKKALLLLTQKYSAKFPDKSAQEIERLFDVVEIVEITPIKISGKVNK